MSEEVQQKIQHVTNTIVAATCPKKVILFGSQADGSAGPDSDVDLFVVQETNAPMIERQRAIRRAVFPAGLALDILVYTPAEIARRLQKKDFFIRDILQKGRVLYEAA